MNQNVAEISWPAEQLGEAFALLARHTGSTRSDVEVGQPQLQFGSENALIEAAAGWCELEAEPVEVSYADVDQFLVAAGPALVRLSSTASTRYLVLVGHRRRGVSVLTPQRCVARVAITSVRQALCSQIEGPVDGPVESMLHSMGVHGRRGRRARKALVSQLIGSARIGGCWLVRPTGATTLMALARQERLPRLLATVLGAHACEYILWLLSWWMLGWTFHTGRLEPGWLMAWLILLLTLIPFRLLSTVAGGGLSIRAGATLKRRLLAGALQLQPDEIRHQGIGALLGRTVEASEIELTALTGGFLACTAVVEIILAGFVLGSGAGSIAPIGLLLAILVVTLLLSMRYYRLRSRWTAQRLNLTNDLVERMVGHRTRLAQEKRDDWNTAEDQALERYVDVSRDFDRAAVRLQALVPRGWLLVALATLGPFLVSGGRSFAAQAAAIGGTVLAYRALGYLVEGLERLTAAAIAGRRISQFWRAAARREPVGSPFAACNVVRFSESRNHESQDHDTESRATTARNGKLNQYARAAHTSTSHIDQRRILLEGNDLCFRYGDRSEPLLQRASFRIFAGDRVLFQGPSGAGKSTLAAILSGNRVADSGLLLLDGLDRDTLGGTAWRRRVIRAPQFHENYVFHGTFAFNLLLGRDWPPQPSDLKEAERVCRALELGPLLDRMPAGLHQVVGETGWQLSHGEKSRLYVARALLQCADVIVLDESFASLDPATLGASLGFVLDEAPALLVIAHP